MTEGVIYCLGIPVMFFVWPSFVNPYWKLRWWARILAAIFWPLVSAVILYWLGGFCLKAIWRMFNN